MTFQEAAALAPAKVSAAFRPGKQALKREHRDLVRCERTERFTGSLALDESLRTAPVHASAARWDYGIGFREIDSSEVAIWVEVHPASTSEVETVLLKYKWLKTWLHKEAVVLGNLTRRTSGKNFYWLATTGGVHIRPGSPQARRLQQAGLDMPRRVIHLE